MNPKIQILLLAQVLFAGVYGPLFGQGDKPRENSIQISLGANHYRLIDQAFTQSKMKFIGTPFMIALSYQRKTDDYAFDAALGGSFGKVVTNNKAIKADADHLNLNLSYARRVFNHSLINMQNKCYLGVQVSSFNSVLANEVILENASLTFYHTLNLVFVHTTQIDEKNGFQMNLALPFLGWVKRSTYDGGANQELEENKSNVGKLFFEGSVFSVLNPLTTPRINFGYTHRIAPKTHFTVTYLFSYLYNKDVEPIKSYSNGLLTGFKFIF